MSVLCDSNIWLALTIRDHWHHSSVFDWRESLPEGIELAFCRTTQNSFLRLLATASVFKEFGEPAQTNVVAWSIFDSLMASERVIFLNEPEGIEPVWRHLSAIESASPKLWMDTYLAAFAIAGGHQLATTDKGFRQFGELDLILL